MDVLSSRRCALLAAVFLWLMTTAVAGADLRLVKAMKDRNTTLVRDLLQRDVDINASQADGATALAWAAHWDDVKAAEMLLAAGADANIANDYGINPLLLACTNGSHAMVRRLLEAGAEPDMAQWMGVTPLMLCSRAGSAESVELLLSRGADVNAREHRRSQTALMWAAAHGHLDVADILTEHPADPDIQSHMPDDFTPRQFMTYGVHKRDPTRPDTIGKDDIHPAPTLSRGGFTALMFAAREGDEAMARLLVDAGANVNVYTPKYGNALALATSSGHSAMALYLLQQGAEPNIKDRWGYSPLHYALQNGINAIVMPRKPIPSDEAWLHENMPEVVEALLASGADPNASVGDGFPPFDYPAYDRTIAGAMPELRQPGATPFLLASASFDVELMQSLVAHGADPLLPTDEGTTPLMVAAGMGRQVDLTPEEESMALEAARMTWELGNDVNASNMDGRTALAAAAYHGAVSLIRFLADKGANLEAQDRYGQTALSIARGIPYKIDGADKRFRQPSSHPAAAELLLSLGAQTD